MAIAGLSFPHLTEADPDLLGEGSIDPLGLAPIADRLADEILPGITARMSRIRFLTAMTVCSSATEPLRDAASVDGTPPYLVFEWHLVMALARARNLPKEALRIAGIDKARAVVARGGFLDARSYLKVPSVFGFNGIYKRLAVNLGVLGPDLSLRERGDQLLRAWEMKEEVPGFSGRSPGTDGKYFADLVERWVGKALAAGQVAAKPQSDLWWRLAHSLRPDAIGSQEKRLLWDWLCDPAEPIRGEVLSSLVSVPVTETEAESLRILRIKASPELVGRLDAIDGYERVAELLFAGFIAIRRISTAARPKLIGIDKVAEHPAVAAIASQLPEAVRTASERLDFVYLSQDFEEVLGQFADVNSPSRFLEALFEHHSKVQANKPPGKRPWFEGDPGRFMVRPQYLTLDEPVLSFRYLHPYRINAVRSFIQDLT